MNTPIKPPADEALNVAFGLKEEWQHFSQTFLPFLKVQPALLELFEPVFLRTMRTSSKAETVVYSLGRLILEEFTEILLLCGNGYGVAASKILRGMYERAVTAAYLAKYPEEVDAFLRYHKIHMGKMLKHVDPSDLKEVFSEEKVSAIESEYEEARKDFQEPVCKKCGTTRTLSSWSRLDTLSMAKKADKKLARQYLYCYFLPTLQIHSTMQALFEQMKYSGATLTFDPDAQRHAVEVAMEAAHLLILEVMDAQNIYFNLGLAEDIAKRRGEWVEAWYPDKQSEQNLAHN